MLNFSNLKIGTKIILGYVLLVILQVVLTAVLLFSLYRLTSQFTFLVQHDQPVLSNIAELEKLMVDMETGERGYLITGKDDFLAPYNNGLTAFDKLLQEQQQLVSDNPPQVQALEEIKSLHEQWLEVAAKPEIAKRQELNKATVSADTLQKVLQGGVGKSIMDQIRGVLDSMKADFRQKNDLESAILTVEIAKDMVDQETGERGFIVTGQENFLEPYIAGQKNLSQHIAALRSLLTNDAINLARLQQVEQLAQEWQEKAAIPEIEARREMNNNPATMADISAMIQAGTGKVILDDMRAKFATFTQKELALNSERSDNATSLANITFILGIIITLASMVLGPTIGWGVSRPITSSAVAMTQAANRLARGDVKQELTITGEDEIGQMANAFRQMMVYQQKMALAAGRLAQGDVTVNITAQSAQDVLGKAFEQMIIYQQKMAKFAGQVAEGDLTIKVTPESNQDVLGNAFALMLRSQKEITSQIRQATSSLSSASAEILSATMEQVSGANEQSAAITQTTSTITEVKTVAEQSFNKAEAVAKASYRSNEISQNGQKAVSEAVEGMRQIKEKVAGIAENILALSEQTQRIGEITATVNEIAAQSNLLALNASVEAARAGEHGKGFAVVAVEVRNLAEQSKQATSQVKAILNEIQRATNSAVMATEEGTKGVDAGVALTQETGSTINLLTQSIAESASAAQQIVASSKQQSAGMEQISLAMQNINQATVQSLASTRQTERSAQDLSALAKQLDTLVARYKLN